LARDLRNALERTRDWERHYVATLPAPERLRAAEGRAAELITEFAGSMAFVYLHVTWFGLWIAVNTGLLAAVGLGMAAFDPFPFGLLTLIVSLEAIFLSTFVMIAQNRLSAQADARAEADYEVNRRAESEIAKLIHLVEAMVEHDVAVHSGEEDRTDAG
jgi:uncharacterized membrane protein